MTHTDQLLMATAIRGHAKRADFGNVAERSSGSMLGTLANEGSYFVPFVGAGRMLADAGSDFAKGRIFGGIGNAIGGLATGALDVFGGAGAGARAGIRGLSWLNRANRFGRTVGSKIPGAYRAGSAIHGAGEAVSRGIGKIPMVGAAANSRIGRSLFDPSRELAMWQSGHGWAGNLAPSAAGHQAKVDMELATANQWADRMRQLPSQLAGMNPLGTPRNPMFLRPGGF